MFQSWSKEMHCWSIDFILNFQLYSEYKLPLIISVSAHFFFRETNLKSRQCEEATNQMGEDEVALSHFNGHIICEAPNSNLSRFEGTMEWEGRKYAIDNDQILLRGAMLRNTEWCYGVVIFAGKDTKLMRNSGKAKFKRTSIDRLLNFIILGVNILLLPAK